MDGLLYLAKMQVNMPDRSCYCWIQLSKMFMAYNLLNARSFVALVFKSQGGGFLWDVVPVISTC